MRIDKNSNFGLIRFMAAKLKKTPLHPQWFIYYREERLLRTLCTNLSGLVLDIGCADSKPREHLGTDAHYIGLDYYSTATDWYNTRPNVYADAQALPFQPDSIDHCLLLDVLEHIPDSDRCLASIHETLIPGGTLTILVPFMYPLHDAPLDFQRWTRFGLLRAASKHGYRITQEDAIGHPLESAALNGNIALSKTALNWIYAKNPLALFGLLLPVAILLINVFAWLFSKLSRADDLMPYGYKMVWTKE